MRDLALTGVERLQAQDADAEAAFQMDEEAFRAFYERTARPVWLYLSRLTGSRQQADDLLQEAYYRFLRTGRRFRDETHRRNYLYRIATNLARDAHRRARPQAGALREAEDPGGASAVHPAAAGNAARDAEQRTDLARAMARLKPRERALLWLAYAQGSTHHEIAASLGLKTSSIKLLLFRARRRLAGIIRSRAEGTGRG